jgi:hypothetical protein
VKKYQSFYTLSIILSFIASITLASQYGYFKGNELCILYYNKDVKDKPSTSFYKIGPKEREELKREAGLTSAIMYYRLKSGKTNIEELKQLQKETEELTDTFITIAQGMEFASMIVVPPYYSLIISGLLGAIIMCLFCFSSLNLLINFLISHLRKTSKHFYNFSSVILNGPIAHLKIVYNFVLFIIRRRKSHEAAKDIIYL